MLNLWDWRPGTKVSVSHEVIVSSRSIVSLREQMRIDPNVGKCLLKAYYPKFCRVFPFKSEREDFETYLAYLTDPGFDWDCRMLFENGEVIGGVQFQHLPVLDTSVVVAEHYWLLGKSWWNTGFRSHDRFEFLGRNLEEVARGKGAKAIVWECNDTFQMTSWQKRLDRKAGLPPEQRLKLWGRYGTVLDVSYAQPRLAPTLDPVEFLMLCARVLSPGFQFTGEFYRAMFRNFVLTFNDDPDSDECFQRIIRESREQYGDKDVIPRIKFGQMRTFLKAQLAG